MQVKTKKPRRTSSKQASNARSRCPISMALELIGDPWSLLIVRDLMFKGRHRYKDFQDAEEGIASNILADRLRRLEASGILGRAADPEDRRRSVYSLSKKGIELAPVLVDLVIWSAKHHDTGAPTAIVRLMRDQRDAFLQGVLDDWASKQKGKSVPGTR